jgi:hypothetical protein
MKWIGEHIFQVKVLLIILILLVVITFGQRSGSSTASYSTSNGSFGATRNMAVSKVALPMSGGGGMSADYAESMPVPAVAPSLSTNRMVVRNSTLSLVVTSVASGLTTIENIATTTGGYLVDSSMSQPEGAANGSITIRVPSEKRAEALASIKAAGLRTVSEQVTGSDVTDEYADLDSRLASLKKTKTKIEDLLDRSGNVSDLMNVQRELMNLQSQIDSVLGQQKYLEGNTKLSRISVYLSTDEFSLPYAPDQPWRPEVVFKQAVRSLVGTLRGLVDWVIWIGVYAPVWVPAGLIIWFLKKKFGQPAVNSRAN